jgi:hypothetical protein
LFLLVLYLNGADLYCLFIDRLDGPASRDG